MSENTGTISKKYYNFPAKQNVFHLIKREVAKSKKYEVENNLE